MNITKILCRLFDEQEKGYVTIGDILKTIPTLTLCIIVLMVYLYGLYEWLFVGFTAYSDPNTLLEVFTGFAIVASAVVTCIAVIVTLLIICIAIYEMIEDIKVVSCEKDSEKDSNK